MRYNHTYLALQLLETGASLTPEAGELLGLHNVLKVPQVLHSLVRAQNVPAIRWLLVRSASPVAGSTQSFPFQLNLSTSEGSGVKQLNLSWKMMIARPWPAEVVLARDAKGRTPRDLVRLGSVLGHRIHSMLLTAEDTAMVGP